MPRIDYSDIVNEIKAILDADSTLTGVQITTNDEPPLDSGAWVAIYLTRREAPSGQYLSAGTKQRYWLKFSIWCWQFSLEGSARASQLRDDLLGKVEVALMGNRTLNDKVDTSWLEGGEMWTMNVEGENMGGYVSGGEIVLMADVSATI